ncbi:C2H2 and C2HC zinc finger [Fusarium albosuccineum]|uniref:C2H2 and C2HC zinc finger n=1 Tax=Fusarium albosuccineum TaxID=1237068 RepID=A0A8H4PMH9_9HYPO|nr:C2H2 and C2HC zinc finger [Fusarium albosuccineum]
MDDPSSSVPTPCFSPVPGIGPITHQYEDKVITTTSTRHSHTLLHLRTYPNEFVRTMATFPETEDISVLLLFLTWTILSTTHTTLLSVGFKSVFAEKEFLENLMMNTPLNFAPGLIQIFQSAVPPTISFFSKLPLPQDRVWGVYVLVLEKDSHPPKIYIGSGTSKDDGVKARISTYDRLQRKKQWESGISDTLAKAVISGYSITYRGLLVWTPIPLASEQHALRGLMLLFETVFTLCFWAMISRPKNYFNNSIL